MWKATTYDNDARFKDRRSKKKQQEGKPEVFKTKLSKADMQHIVWESVSRWIELRTAALLDGIEDEILVSFITESLTAAEPVDAYELSEHLQGFLGDKAEGFVEELWKLLVDASSNAAGVPKSFLSQPLKSCDERRDPRHRRSRQERGSRWGDRSRSRSPRDRRKSSEPHWHAKKEDVVKVEDALGEVTTGTAKDPVEKGSDGPNNRNHHNGPRDPTSRSAASEL